MELKEFVENNDVIRSPNRIDEEDFPLIEIALGEKIGEQLREYILEYGCLGYNYVMFFGVNRIQGPRSELVMQTLYLHEDYPKTKGMIAVADLGDGDYYLVDSEDNVYRYLASRDELTETGMRLFDFILKQFTE